MIADPTGFLLHDQLRRRFLLSVTDPEGRIAETGSLLDVAAGRRRQSTTMREAAGPPVESGRHLPGRHGRLDDAAVTAM